MKVNSSAFRRYGLLLLLALLFCVYTLTNAGEFHVVEEVSLFAVTESLALRGEVDTNAIAYTQWVDGPAEAVGAVGENGEIYSKKGPATAFLAVPWYALVRFLAERNITLGLVQGTLLWNGLITALTALLLWLAALRLGYPDRVGMALGLLFGLATIAWPYANHFLGEPLSAFSLLLCFYGLISWRAVEQMVSNPRRPVSDATRGGSSSSVTYQSLPSWVWMLVAGLGAGLATAAAPAHALIVAVLASYILLVPLTASRAQRLGGNLGRPTPRTGLRVRHLLAILLFLLPILLAVALLLRYNALRFGDPLATGYRFDAGEGFTTPIWQGLWGLLFSPYRGVFWYTPLFIVSLAAFPAFVRRHRLEAVVIFLASTLLIGLYSTWWVWWGGLAWGPRFLVPLGPLWVLLLAPLVNRFATLPWMRGFELLRYDANRFYEVLVANLQRLDWRHWLLLLLAPLSIVVQALAVLLNYTNGYVQLCSLFPTSCENPLVNGPPALAPGDWLASPIPGQIRLLRDFASNADLAWLWQIQNLAADAATTRVRWLVPLVGSAALLTLSVALSGWWRASNTLVIAAAGPNRGARLADDFNRLPSPPVRWLFALLPVLVASLWLGQASASPDYGAPQVGYRAALASLCEGIAPGDAVVTVAPAASQIPMNWLGSSCPIEPPLYGLALDSATQEEARVLLARALGRHDRLWLLTGGVAASAPENSVEQWLAGAAYQADAAWHDDYRLLRYGTPVSEDDSSLILLDVPLTDAPGSEQPNRVRMLNARLPTRSQLGDVLPIEIRYELEAPGSANLRWFVQLLNAEGLPVALLDTMPADGYAPFATLPVGESIVENAGLQLPSTLPAAEYQAIAGLYNPQLPGNPRLRSLSGEDFVSLGFVRIEAE